MLEFCGFGENRHSELEGLVGPSLKGRPHMDGFDVDLECGLEFQMSWVSGKRSLARFEQYDVTSGIFSIALYNQDRTGPTRTYEFNVTPTDAGSGVEARVINFGGPILFLLLSAFGLFDQGLAHMIGRKLKPRLNL